MGQIADDHFLSIPTVDLSPFFDGGDARCRKTVVASIGDACRNYGFFRIVNHGVPKSLMARAIECSKVFFARPYDEKLLTKTAVGSPAGTVPAGYDRQPECSQDKNEYFMVFSPELGQNLYPANPHEFKQVLEDCYNHLSKTSVLVEEILAECMGLPPNFLREYNKDPSTDFLTALRYFPANGGDDNRGISEHQDGNFLTFVFQDDVGGLEVLKDDHWLPVDPIEGTIIVNVGDIVQVLSNNKFKSATHRVVRGKRDRYSFAFFFHHMEEGKWVEPLPQFTSQINEVPKYRKFLYKEYLHLRMTEKLHPPFFKTNSPPPPTAGYHEEPINISHYAINNPKKN